MKIKLPLALITMLTLYVQASILTFESRGPNGDFIYASTTNDLLLLDKETDEYITKFKKTLDSEWQQQPQNIAGYALSVLTENKLFCTYHLYRASLSPDKQIKLDEEIRIWDKITNFYVKKAYNRYKGGTLASLSASLEDIRRTESMINILEKRMQ